VEDATDTACGAFEAVHTQARGILGSPEGAQLQVNETVLWTKYRLFVMVPPRAVHASALDPNAHDAIRLGVTQ